MLLQLLKPSILRRSICTCYNREKTQFRFVKQFTSHKPIHQQLNKGFHSSRSSRVPILPIPAIILGALKTGKLVSLVSLSSKTSLTLLPHTFRRGSKGDLIAKVLAGIPLFGFTLLLLVGLDQAPNTSRLRLIYLSEDEEKEIVEAEIQSLLETQSGLVAPKDSEIVMWLQTIVDNLAVAVVDDIRDPVRRYSDDTTKKQQSNQIQVVPKLPTSGELEVMVSTQEQEEYTPVIPKRNFEVSVIWDKTTVNAMCAGSHILVYDLMIHCMEYNTNHMAVILSHEIAHSLQRHFVEQHGFASLMFMLGDITRGVFWMVTESLGPYVNQKINDYISTFITLETQTTYNRKLEKEADLVGLKILAKAGYDPRFALDVWKRMSELESILVEEVVEKKQPEITRELVAAKRSVPSATEEEERYEDLEYGVFEFLDALVNSWFGSSHPPSEERIEYMREHMDEAIVLYEQAIKLNGPPTEFLLSEDFLKQQQMEITNHEALGFISNIINQLYSTLTYWTTKQSSDEKKLAISK